MSEILHIANEMVKVRHHLHRNPELSFQEFETCSTIANILKSHNIEFTIVANTGLLAVVKGCDGGSDTLVRADIDALPIEEQSGVEYTSCKSGVMHACGHDIHTAVLLGVLIYFNSHRESFSGRLIALFEPGEEMSPGGASLVIREGALSRYNITRAFALHTAHDINVGLFGVKDSAYMASTSEMRIKVKGSGGHAALPALMTNPLYAASKFVVELKSLERDLSSLTMPVIVAIGSFIGKGSTNVIPSEVSLEGTVRAMSVEAKGRVKDKIGELAAIIALETGVEFEVLFSDGYPPVTNCRYLADEFRRKISEMYGVGKVIELGLRMTADDFGFFSEIYPSLYYRIGVKEDGVECYAPHTSQFVASDKSIVYGIESLVAMIKNR